MAFRNRSLRVGPITYASTSWRFRLALLICPDIRKELESWGRIAQWHAIRAYVASDI